MASSSSNLHGFFQPRKRKVKTIDLVNDEEVPPPTEEAPPPPKQAKPVTKYNKRRTATGFTEQNITEKLVMMTEKKQAEGNWRKSDVLEITYTTVEVKWTFNEQSTSIFHFSPWGMKESVKKKQTSAVVHASFEVLPLEIKEKLGNINCIEID